MSTLGTFHVSESRTGYVHTARGPVHVSGLYKMSDLPPRLQKRPWLEYHRFASHLKVGERKV